MTRQTAWEILSKYLKNPNLIKHSLATEATMRALAPRYEGDVEEWGVVGLLHDADYERSKGHPEEHGLLLFKLEPNSIPAVIEHAIKAHNFEFTKIAPESPMDWAIYCCDQLTGLIVAAALVHPDKKLASLNVEFILNRMKQKDFAKGATREQILLCEEKLGIPLNEFIDITLHAMQGISKDLEL
ncbi:MAG TPA: HD domain-containing protein [Patescibacteria group bacterium]